MPEKLELMMLPARFQRASSLIKSKLRAKRDTIYDKFRRFLLNEPRLKILLSLQQMAFMYCVCVWVIILSVVILTAYPQYWKYWYTLIMMIVLPIRYYQYWTSNMVAFCFDFCYWANLVTILALFTESTLLLRISQGISFSVLLASIIWQNKMVFHSLDKMTSCFVHIFPSLSLYLYNFVIYPSKFPISSQRASLSSFYLANSPTDWLHPTFSFTSHVVHPMMYYLLWQFGYALICDVLNADLYQNDHTRLSSVHYFVLYAQNYPIALKAQDFARKIGWFKPDEVLDGYSWNTKLLFYAFQFVYTLILLVFGWLQYYSHFFAASMLVFCTHFVIYEGSTFYLSSAYICDRIDTLIAAQAMANTPTPALSTKPLQSQHSSATSPNQLSAGSMREKEKKKQRAAKQRKHLQDIHDKLHIFFQSSEMHETVNNVVGEVVNRVVDSINSTQSPEISPKPSNVEKTNEKGEQITRNITEIENKPETPPFLKTESIINEKLESINENTENTRQHTINTDNTPKASRTDENTENGRIEPIIDITPLVDTPAHPICEDQLHSVTTPQILRPQKVIGINSSAPQSQESVSPLISPFAQWAKTATSDSVKIDETNNTPMHPKQGYTFVRTLGNAHTLSPMSESSEAMGHLNVFSHPNMVKNDLSPSPPLSLHVSPLSPDTLLQVEELLNCDTPDHDEREQSSH